MESTQGGVVSPTSGFVADEPVLNRPGDALQRNRIPTRREMLFGGALLAALLGAGCPTSTPDPNPDPPPPPPPPPPDDEALLKALVNRVTFGQTPEELQLAHDLGYDAYLEYHLNPEAIDDSALDRLLAPYTTLSMSTYEIIQAQDTSINALDELLAATILRSTYSKRQLFERMVEFWSDHFNIYMEKDGQYILKPVNDREVIRQFALTTFPDLASASSHSPSMLAYLDNDPSSKEAPNQNYAREFMELHTMGVDTFTQTDVENVARCFTGWSLNFDWQDTEFGTFKFYNWNHDSDAKTVLGHAIPANGGITDGQTVLDLITRDPQISQVTARFIAKKLAKKFWGYNPPDALVTETANAYTANGGDVRAMLRIVLSKDWMAQSTPKLKRPYHYVVSSLRVLNAVVESTDGIWAILYVLDLMGHTPFNWAPPNGYPDVLAFWSGLLLRRWRFGALIPLQEDYINLDLAPYLNVNLTNDQVVDLLNTKLFAGGMSNTESAQLLAFLQAEELPGARRKEAIGLALSSPSFQWY